MKTIEYSIWKRGILLLQFLAIVTFTIADSAHAGPPPMTESEFVSEVGSEYEYRKQLEVEAPKWASELVYLYKWSIKHPIPYHPLVGAIRGDIRPTADELEKRMNSEFAWMLVAGHGLIATFDFKHAEQSLLGSTSRLVAGLVKSRAFWREVKVQCREVSTLAKQYRRFDVSQKSCAEQLESDLRASQLVGSNVSLFVGGGLVVGLGKRVFSKYFSSWFARRVLPMVPQAARSSWVLGGLTATLVVLPAGYLVAAMENERNASKEFLETLPDALRETEDLLLKESVLRRQALELERDVVQLANWINRRLPIEPVAQNLPDDVVARQDQDQRFIAELKMSAPGFQSLVERREFVANAHRLLEAELGQMPSADLRLKQVFEKRRLSGLQGLDEEERAMLRKAQYLAALRLVLPVINAQ